MQKRFWSVPVATASGVYHDIIPLFAGMEKCLPTNHYGPYLRSYHLVHYCIRGSGTYVCHDTGESFEVGAGQIFVIRPEEMNTYSANPKDPWEYVWIGFCGRVAQRFSGMPKVVDYPADTFFRIAEAVKAGIVSADYYAAMIFEIMHHLFFNAQQPLDVTGQVRRHIELNYMENLTVEEMATQFGLNRRYLSRIFKERYGVSVKEFIVRQRMDRAREFLAAGYSVSEVAFMSGYSDVFNFSKMFHKIVGVSPSEYKKSPRG